MCLCGLIGTAIFVWICVSLGMQTKIKCDLLFSFLKDVEFMERKLEDLEKRMKRSNDKQLKIGHECSQRVSTSSS